MELRRLRRLRPTSLSVPAVSLFLTRRNDMRENPFIPIYRACNNGTNEEKYARILSGEVRLPRYMDVELTNLCNFRCRFCPTGTGAMRRTRGHMPDEVADALVENVARFRIPGVRFIRWGEPTMHPKYIDIMARVKEAGAAVHINTNGSLLDEGQIRRLLDMDLDSIKFSFQGADKGTYNEMRAGGDYGRLLVIVRLMYELRGDRPRPWIQISTTLTGESAEQVESFKRDVAPWCDYYNIGYTQLNHLDVDAMSVSPEERERIRELQRHETLHHVYRPVCGEAFDKLSLNWNGDATLCCSDYDNFLVIGNILDMDIEHLFNSRAADAYRQIIAKRQYGRIACCSTCYETVPLQR